MQKRKRMDKTEDRLSPPAMASSALLHAGTPAAGPSDSRPAPTLRFVARRSSVPRGRQ